MIKSLGQLNYSTRAYEFWLPKLVTQCGWFSGSKLETKISHDNKLINGKEAHTHVPGKEEIPKPQEAQAKVE